MIRRQGDGRLWPRQLPRLLLCDFQVRFPYPEPTPSSTDFPVTPAVPALPPQATLRAITPPVTAIGRIIFLLAHPQVVKGKKNFIWGLDNTFEFDSATIWRFAKTAKPYFWAWKIKHSNNDRRVWLKSN